MSGRINLRLDKGLGWTKPLFVACCGACGTQLARHTSQAAATRAAGRRRCPACGTRTARRLPGTTSPATDLALTCRGRPGQPRRQPRPLDHHPHPSLGGMPPIPIPRPRSRPRSRSVRSSGRSPVMARRSLWQIDMGDGTWAVCCMACRLALYRGDKRTADRIFAGHRCEPVVPLGRRRRRRPA
jgi:hypothetical protein